MIKNCTTCKYEPNWDICYPANTFNDCCAGVCKFPIPMHLSAMVCKDEKHIGLKDNEGKYFFKMYSGCKCYAWEAK